MANDFGYDDGEGSGAKRWLLIAVACVVLLGVVWFIYTRLTDAHGVKVEAPSPTAINMLPPPPPPPPPPPQPKPPEPLEKANPVPSVEPKPAAAPAAPAPVSINGPAQAGTDSFGLQAGNGGGSGGGGGGTCVGANCGGGGMGETFYRRYISAVLQEKVQRDDRVNRLLFAADFGITIDPNGRITQVEILKSSGNDARDQMIKTILLAVTNLDPPPPVVKFPQRITVRGRRSL